MSIKDTNISDDTLFPDAMVMAETIRSPSIKGLLFAVIVFSALRGVGFIYLGIFEFKLLNYVVIGLINLANIIFGVALWKWKKWGVYGITGVLLVNAVLFIMFSDFGLAIFTHIIAPILLLWGIRNAWKPDEKAGKETEVDRNRGIGLTLVIFYIILDGILGVIGYFNQFFGGGLELIEIVFWILLLVGIISGIAIWKWKKWGVYGVFAVYTITAGYFLTYPDLINNLINIMTVLGILALVLRNRWKYFY